MCKVRIAPPFLLDKFFKIVYIILNIWVTQFIIQNQSVKDFNGYFHSESVSTFRQRLKTFLLLLEIII